MSDYRQTIYRYSTGQGPNLASNMVPKEKYKTAGYKFRPLQHNLGLPQTEVALVRQADRLSYQLEEADRILKIMGWDSEAAKRREELKSQLDLVNHLMMNYPITKIKIGELDILQDLWKKSLPGIDTEIERIINQSKATGSPAYIESARKTRKGYPVFDKFGKVVALPAAAAAPTGAGFGDFTQKSLLKYGILLALIILLGSRFTK